MAKAPRQFLQHLERLLHREHPLPPLIWFFLANAGVCVLLSFSILLFGLDSQLAMHNLYLHHVWLGVMVSSLFGTLILLLSSRLIVRVILDARLVDENSGTKEHQLQLILVRQSEQAGIVPPQLAVYHSDDLNAFAIGHSNFSAMIVISRGLLDHLSLDELSAVIGHEITHIANGDMLALSIMQGVLNLFVHLPARLAGIIFDQWLLNKPAPGPVSLVVSILLHLFIGGLTAMLVMWFSRHREFRADAGGAMLAGQAEMLAALRSLYAGEQKNRIPSPLSIYGMTGQLFESRILRFFRSHPSLAERIDALRSHRVQETG
ncbi:MAG: M48 family metalloprotease [Gammaproteobacteria bacterium]|nr:M48 family metalloprotease [Gammaproteobacteria bacterium]MDH5651077.1 M48 family metalloprotease [Gammaproteobacteria bacterium]